MSKAKALAQMFFDEGDIDNFYLAKEAYDKEKELEDLIEYNNYVNGQWESCAKDTLKSVIEHFKAETEEQKQIIHMAHDLLGLKQEETKK